MESYLNIDRFFSHKSTMIDNNKNQLHRLHNLFSFIYFSLHKVLIDSMSISKFWKSAKEAKIDKF